MRKGYTLVEVLVSLILMGIVVTMVMRMLQSQHQNWKAESDRADAGMMALGTLEEITRSIRATGGGMPPGIGGVRTWSPSTPGVTFVVNRSRWIDTVGGYTYVPADRKLRLAIDTAANFSDQGYALVTIRRPSFAGPLGVPNVDSAYLFPILDRVVAGNSCTTDSLVLDAGVLANAPNNWTNPANVMVSTNGLIYNIDSVTFRKSNDTLYSWANRSAPMVYALGVDTLRFQYHHPVAGWGDTLSSSVPPKALDMVRVRVVIRNRRQSQWLADHDPSSRGYRFSRVETEISMRNDSLVNR
jgi:prepilin-type N-terminal cleavage/methylation domain-containing protein